MRLAVTVAHLDEIGPLTKQGADVFVVGALGLSHRLKHGFDMDAITTVIHAAQKVNTSVWVSLNAIIHTVQLEHLDTTMAALAKTDVEAIVFADLAVFKAAEKYKLIHKLIYAPETYTTCTEDVQFWKNEQIAGVIMARESTLEDLVDATAIIDFPVHVVGHGHLNMFHSRRPLIEHYFEHTSDRTFADFAEKKTLTLQEEIRDERYPIVQDTFGTHVFRAKPLASFNVLPVLARRVHTMIIDTLFVDQKEALSIVLDYKHALSGMNVDTIKAHYASTHDDGFYFKKTLLQKEVPDE